MAIKQHLKIRTTVLKDHVNKYAILGLGISFVSIFMASILVSYQLTGFIDIPGVIRAQESNPALWALDLTPLLFAYWGQSFCYELASSVESLIEDKTRELEYKSSELESRLHYETNHDHLTNLPNQRLLSQRINQGIQQIHKGEELAVIILHIGGFKEVNYQYGSFNANNLLVQFAEKLKSVLLEPYLLQAYMGMNMAARLQGAEFAVLIPRLRKEHHFDDLITKILASTSSNYMIDGNSINIKTSAGVALYPQHGDNDLSLIRHANFSVFHAEKEGKPFAIYRGGMDKGVNFDQLKIRELKTAIDKDQIIILYQPELQLKTEKIVGVEALCCYDDPKAGLSDINKCLPLLEGTDVVKKLTRLIVKKAVAQVADWLKENQTLYVTLNLLDAADEDLPAYIDQVLKEYQVSSEHLKLALTEKACLEEQTRTVSVLKQLANLGIRLVINDFCSGYSSFIYLTNFPITDIKIDKSFVMNMMQDEKKLRVVRTVIRIAETLNLVAYADGIPDKQTMKELVSLGYIYGQAAYLSEACRAEEITSLIR